MIEIWSHNFENTLEEQKYISSLCYMYNHNIYKYNLHTPNSKYITQQL